MSISNRRRLACLAVGGLMATTAACAGGTTGSGKVTGFTKPIVTTPEATGELDHVTWNLPSGEPTTLDPAKVGDYSPSTVEANLCDPLLRLKPDYSYGPGLAESWSTPDPTTLVLNLRSDVTFWDGQKLTPRDVVYSLTRQQDPNSGSVNTAYFANVASITETGPAQVTIKFTKSDELFLKLLSTSVGAVSQEAYAKKARKDYGQVGGGLMCTGPFKLASWKSGASITIARNTAYWDPALRPKAAEVEFKFITDGNTLSSALLSGQIDGSYEVPLQTIRALDGNGIGSHYYGIATQSVTLLVASDKSPLADKRLTDALSLALDRNAIIKNVFGGAAATEKTFIPPPVWQGSEARATFKHGYDALPEIPPVDLEEAKKLVEQVNPARRTLTVATPAGEQMSMQILTFLQAGAKKIGLDLQIKQMQMVDFSNVFYDPTKRDGLDMVIAFGYIEVPDPVSYAPAFTAPDGLFNWSGYNNPKVTDLLKQAQSTLDPAKSAEIFNQAQALYTSTWPGLSVAAPYERMFMNKRISGAPASFAHINLPWAAMIGGTGK
ncbi:ABC transporter substrate-binding protein [Streptomyces sp. NBC_01618]|uniref:ABC transporter substrate-binding protein n=1 Tax=Streptomyces sp. NBC_01618 TaxID=2975900 RepID=UPI00386BA64C|nr:ABC transporter substrate-binding protein [Streptomyces sp. NBC_01618]